MRRQICYTQRNHRRPPLCFCRVHTHSLMTTDRTRSREAENAEAAGLTPWLQRAQLKLPFANDWASTRAVWRIICARRSRADFFAAAFLCCGAGWDGAPPLAGAARLSDRLRPLASPRPAGRHRASPFCSALLWRSVRSAVRRRRRPTFAARSLSPSGRTLQVVILSSVILTSSRSR